MIRYLLFAIIKYIFYIFYIFPIKSNKILFISFGGKRYFCNPKYIFLNIYQKLPHLEYIWVLNNYCHELAIKTNVCIVNHKSILRIYHMLTAKVIILNTHLVTYIPYRREQIIINTWHGGGAYKKIGAAEYLLGGIKDWRSIRLKQKYVLSKKHTRYFISSSKKFTEIMQESWGIECEKFLTIGMPRNDIFFRNNNELIKKIKHKLNINNDFGTVLFAPTFRGKHSYIDTHIIMDFNFEKIKKVLEKKYNKKYICLFKSHPALSIDLHYKNSIDVTQYDDMQELLLIADVLITDYSSSIWDFSFTKKPCFLFTPDLDQYLTKDRGFYTPIETWPFLFARTNKELCENIMNFNQADYEEKIKKHHEDLGSYENGTATEKVTELLMEIFKE